MSTVVLNTTTKKIDDVKLLSLMQKARKEGFANKEEMLSKLGLH